MVSDIFLANLKKLVPDETIKLRVPMKQYTTFRTGGEADCLITLQNKEQLARLLSYFHRTGQNFFLLGLGSNLLISDKGYQGVVLKLSGELEQIHVEGERIRAGAGASLARAARAAYEHGLTGLEFASGIPGSVGGGIVMNAGAYGGEMKQVVESVTLMDEEGAIVELKGSEMEFGYRASIVRKRSYIVLEAVMRLEQGNAEQIGAAMEELAIKRREKQPLEYPSAGSTFKRPEGFFAGKLIMDAGLRGFSIGGAQVSEKHCGFIINRGGATSEDVYRLICRVKQEVREQFGVELEPEVVMLGEFV